MRKIGRVTIFAALVLLLLGATGVLANPGDYSVEVADRHGYAMATLNDDAIIEYIGDLNTTYGSSGTGTFEPFVRLQADPTEKGYNTDGALEFDTKSSKWTHSILLSEIPTVLVDGKLYWEFWADINESDKSGGTHISLDDFELWLTSDPNLTGYDFGSAATKIYDYTDANDGYFVLINDVNQGSGRGDLRYLVPQDSFDPGDCNYGNPACTTYLVLYSEWGGKSGDYISDGGFEEWKVKKYPILQVSKDIYGAYDTPVSWRITKDTDATYDLFAGESATHPYTVTVDPIFGAPENTKVWGTITIYGDFKKKVGVVNATITDSFEDSPATITGCSVLANADGTYPIEAGATVTCWYELDLDAPVGGRNVARASYNLDTVALAFQSSANILVGDYVETLTGDPVITVDDTNLIGEAWSASAASETWTYTRDFTCSSDPDDYTAGFYSYTHDNTATIVETGDSDDATVTVNCYAPVVSKDVNPYYTRDWDWTITKDWDGSYDMFAGDSVSHGYKVSVTPSSTDNGWGVSGTITITNPHPTDAMTLSDVVDWAGGIETAVDCPSMVVPSQGSLVCSYDTGAKDSPDSNPFGAMNIATAVFAGSGWKGKAPIEFGGPTTELDPVITVDDDNLSGEDWSADRAYAEWTYTRDFTCPTDLSRYTDGIYSFSHTNTATINETGQWDQAKVDVNCYALLVSKDAQPSFTRTYHWTIDKVVDNPGPITVQRGQSVDVNYAVTVDLANPAYTDSNWAVAGTIVINNPAPMAASLSSVIDTISPDISAAVSCPALTVPPEGSLGCTYSASLPDAAFRTNTATATLADIGTSFSGSADVDFSTATVNEVDEKVDVVDSYAGFLGTVHYSQAPATFTYPRTITAPDPFCGSYTVDNTATFTTNDTGATGSDDAHVTIEVPCEGCTPGFWQGGAGAPLWDQVDDPDWTYGGTNPFIHTTLFNDFFNVVIDPRLVGYTMYDLVSSGGGSDPAVKAARDMVAAYLNESAFPTTFPADSLTALETMWYDAVAGGDDALDAFHNLVAGWNAPPEPGYCPLP